MVYKKVNDIISDRVAYMCDTPLIFNTWVSSFAARQLVVHEESTINLMLDGILKSNSESLTMSDKLIRFMANIDINIDNKMPYSNILNARINIRCQEIHDLAWEIKHNIIKGE